MFSVAVFTSAALVFLVEPMVAKLVLPDLGGSPAVWNTSLAFFQAALLVGYVYAHLLQRLPSVKSQAIVHGVVLIVSAATLPVRVSQALGEPGALPPALWLMGVLTLSVGAPFAALSATAPLVQAWYARLSPRDGGSINPYVLYAASNFGSLLALLAYPVVVEPILRLKTQTLAWSLGYCAFMLLMGAVARIAWNAHGPLASAADPHASDRAPRWRDRLTWIALAAAPSSLMLGVTTHITTDIASAPFLWVLPLALYLLTFIIAFQARPIITPRLALIGQAAVVPLCFLSLALPGRLAGPQFLTINLAAFFLTALICHQALVARRPPAAQLTEFYLLMSIGGVIGGGFNAFVAPLIFKTVLEYPLVLALACLARPWGKGRPSSWQIGLLLAGLGGVAAAMVLKTVQSLGVSIAVLAAIAAIVPILLRDRSWMFLALCVALGVSASLLTAQSNLLATDRSFFGVLRLNRVHEPSVGDTRELYHGTTLHGAQAEGAAYRCHPFTYYAPRTPIGQVFTTVEAAKPAIRIGAIGMGAGTVAAYTRAGDSMRFFEIDPVDVRIATDPAQFTYIRGCARGRVDWVLGDARLKLAQEPKEEFDLLLVDAFSSDTVPAHLLTVEAMRGYLTRIKPDGVIIMHLSNRNLDLMSPVAGVATAAGGVALQQTYISHDASLISEASEQTIIVVRDPATLAAFARDPRWRPAQSHGVRVWTDDYTDLFGAFVRRVAHGIS